MAEPIQLPISELDHHAARVFVSVSVTLLALSFATLTGRMVFKIQSKLHFTIDDCLIVAGFLLAVTTWALLLAVIELSVPSSRTFLTMDQFSEVIKLGVLAVPISICSIACIKVSVACLLLRLAQNTIWATFLYILIGTIISTSTAFFIFDFLQCIPLAAAWDTSIQGKCVSMNTFRIMSNATTGINIATDVILSLFPLTFLRQMRRPLMEKVLVGFLMALGMTAAAASIAKAVYVRDWVHAVDTFAVGYSISNLTCVELFLGITAACLPSFKPTFQRLLTSMGLDFSFSGSYSFFRSIHGSSNPPTVVRDSIIEDTRSQNPMTSTSSSVEMADLSNKSTRPEYRVGEGSKDSGASNISDDIV